MEQEEFDAMLYKSIKENFYLDIGVCAGEVTVKLKMFICQYGGSKTVLEASVGIGD